ncbi:MAG: carboxypeptidase-like regulatory domain-containing protein [Candidatus Desulfatibia sp.]|uniref:carboxypeptidase-like regulatory domain-containing protein n=1 Tax=Candidatus Desulfatibia sp. TaxID=3101189 RepID=UPI002F346348
MRVLKTLFIAIFSLTLIISPAYGASQGKGTDKHKAKSQSENTGSKNNGKIDGGRSNSRSESAGSYQNTIKSRKINARSEGRAAEQGKRKNQIERTKAQADTRTNRLGKENNGQSIGHSETRRNNSSIGGRGRSADRRQVKESPVNDLLKALDKARSSFNSHDKSKQGNLEKPDTTGPYGYDKNSDRGKKERGRPIPGEQQKQPLLDLAGIATSDFEIQDYMLTYLKDRLTYYSSLAQISDYMTRWVAYYESLVDSYLEKYSEYRIRVNMEDKIDYTMKFSPPEGFEGTKLIVTTTLTSVNDYQYSTWHHVNDPGSNTGHWETNVIEYKAGEMVLKQTQEIMLGEDSILSFSYDPPSDLAGDNGFNANLSVTVTEPVSGQSYTMNPDKQIYLYRVPYGKVTNAKTALPIAGAKITIHFEDESIVPLDKAPNPTATNPQITDATGRYGVKFQTSRKYYITAEAPGYKPYKSEIFTEKWHVLREDIKLTPIDQVASGR